MPATSDLATILQIQVVDSRAEELRAEIDKLPRYVAEIERKLASHKAQLAAEKTAVASSDKERRQLEAAIAAHEEKASKLLAQMSEAKTNDQYRAFRNEIAFERKEVKNAEDRILDIMEESEAAQQRVSTAEKALAAESEIVGKEVEEAKARVSIDQEQLAEVMKERESLAAIVKPGLLKAYERVSKRGRGAAVSKLENNRCESCNMLVRPHLVQRLRQGDEIISCEFCSAILYEADEPVTLEDPAGEAEIV